MSERNGKATVSKGRTGYCVIFRHPILMTSDQKQKRRIRRGLATRDEVEARNLVGQLNKLMEQPDLHTVAAKPQAAAQFDSRIIAAFYDKMEAKARDPWQDRERLLPRPTIEQGYATVLMVGTTGSGKTTLVRQFLGTDPEKERFPSTSAAKTTTADYEVIVADSDFKAVVSFVSRDSTRQYIADCVIAATSGHIEGAQQSEIARRFMEHSEMRFRMNYLLGSLEVPDDSDTEELLDDDDLPEPDESAEVDTDEQRSNAEKLREFLLQVADLADTFRDQIREAESEFNLDDKARAADREAVQALVEEQIVHSEEFNSLVDDIIDEVERRFEFVTVGDFDRGNDDWPLTWQFESSDRAEFIREVNRFSSNYSPNFGRLLTPLVEGVRVQGPFKARWADDNTDTRIVLLDGQGVGHTADTSASISTNITRRFQIADSIVLVDNAAQPMQAGASAVLSTLVASGHESKLAICFTHFDDLKDVDNLRSNNAKKDHVTGSYFGVVKAIGQRNGREAEHALTKLIPDRLVFVSDIQKPVPEGKRFTRSELSRLHELIRSSIIVPEPPEISPFYDVANLVLAIQKATQVFHGRWDKLLTLEHWARIKALSRRLGERNEIEYGMLMPVADLMSCIATEVSVFLADPYKWEPPAAGDDRKDDKLAAVGVIRRGIHNKLYEFARDRILDGKLTEWLAAYNHRGRLSTWRRSNDIRAIYASAAPIPNQTPTPNGNDFLFAIRELVAEAIKDGGGNVSGWER